MGGKEMMTPDQRNMFKSIPDDMLPNKENP